MSRDYEGTCEKFVKNHSLQKNCHEIFQTQKTPFYDGVCLTFGYFLTGAVTLGKNLPFSTRHALVLILPTSVWSSPKLATYWV
ncbi:hypothetical protein EMIT0P74_140017 [Pseudomonas sp. IT-P74]